MKRVVAGLLSAFLMPLFAASAAAQGLWTVHTDTNRVYEITLDGDLISSFPTVRSADESISIDPTDGGERG